MQQLSHLERARVRARVRRAMAAADDEAHEGGELNLVPYLDILVNTIIFLLATTVSIVPLAEVQAQAPREVDPAVVTASHGGDRLLLTVAVSDSGFIVAGAGGVLRDRSGRLPTIPCAASLEAGRCPAGRYDHHQLTRLAWRIKQRHPDARRVFVSADRNVPYRVIVRTMDALRGKSTARCTGKDGCLFDRVVFSAGVQ